MVEREKGKEEGVRQGEEVDEGSLSYASEVLSVCVCLYLFVSVWC